MTFYLCSENKLENVLNGQITFADNRKGNIVVLNREKDVLLQNSAFIEDSFHCSDDEMSVETVSNEK